jgi:hypothetical protein
MMKVIMASCDYDNSGVTVMTMVRFWREGEDIVGICRT